MKNTPYEPAHIKNTPYEKINGRYDIELGRDWIANDPHTQLQPKRQPITTTNQYNKLPTSTTQTANQYNTNCQPIHEPPHSHKHVVSLDSVKPSKVRKVLCQHPNCQPPHSHKHVYKHVLNFVARHQTALNPARFVKCWSAFVRQSGRWARTS